MRIEVELQKVKELKKMYNVKTANIAVELAMNDILEYRKDIEIVKEIKYIESLILKKRELLKIKLS